MLEAWAAAAAARGGPLDLFTLDYHTDTLPAFAARLRDLSGEAREAESLRLVAAVDWRDPAAVREAITRLRYDEHIDCAYKAGLLGTIVVGLGCRTPQHTPHFARVLLPPDLPERVMCDRLLEDETLLPWIAELESARGRPLEAGGYVFDVDLDYFRTARGAAPATHSALDQLIAHAELVTIAREPGCVGLLRLPGEYIISADLEKSMLAHIARCG